jgi:hypothetical protein
LVLRSPVWWPGAPGKDPEQLGDQPERLLEAPTYERIAIRGLSTALDELPEPPLAGEWPMRGCWHISGRDAVNMHQFWTLWLR